MTHDLALDEASATRRSGWRERLCARLGGLCALLRLTHAARVPF